MHYAMRRKFLSLFIPFGWLAFSVCALAQLPTPDANLDTGIKPYETFDRAQENVKIASGNLEAEIPLVHLPGRNGHDFDLKLVYNSQNWSPIASPYQSAPPNLNPGQAYIGWEYPQAGTNGTNVGSTGWQLNVPVLYVTGVTTPPSCTGQEGGACYCTGSYSQSSQWTNFYLVMGDGTKYQFPHASFLNWQTTANEVAGPCGDFNYTTLPTTGADVLIDYDSYAEYGGFAGDGVMLDLTNAASGSGTAVVRFRDGSQIQFAMNGGSFGQPQNGVGPATASGTLAIPPSALVDPNGNVIDGFPAMPTGSTGESVSSSYSNSLSLCGGQAGSQYQYTDSNGAPATVTLCLSSQFPNAFPTWQTPVANRNNYTGPDYGVEDVYSGAIQNMLSAVVLPDGLTYTFQYNIYGELTEITYPSGGYTRYIYTAIQGANKYQWTSSISGSADRRVVSDKYSCPGQAVTAGAITPSGYVGGTPASTCPVAESHTTYTANSQATNQVAVVDPLGNETDYVFGGLTCTVQPAFTPDAGFLNYGYGISAMEVSRQVYQGPASSGKLLRAVYSNYNSGCQPGLKTSEMTVLPNGSWSETTWKYDTAATLYSTPAVNDHGTMIQSLATAETDNMLAKSEYGFGSGPAPTSPPASPNLPLLRQTVNSYLSQGFTANPVNGIDYELEPVYILNRLADKQVKNGTGGTVAEPSYTYDSYAGGPASSGAVQHEQTYGTGYTTRGNVTAVKYFPESSDPPVTAGYQYDDAGNVLLKTDSLGNQTTYSFSDAWGNSSCAPSNGVTAAFPTTITNAMGEITKYTWNSCTGTMASTKDPNSQTTSFAYDVMDRRVEASYPDGGQTCLQYSDAENSTCPSVPGVSGALPITIGETQSISTSGTAETNIISLDGLSRVSQTELYSDPQNPDYVKTTYDLAGNVASVTNPFRTTSDPTYGSTQYQYDALHRKVIQTQQDGTSILQWCYDGLAISGQQTVCSPNLGSQATLVFGSWVDIADENSNHWQQTTDGPGRLVKVIEPSATSSLPTMETDYSYDPLDDLTLVKQYGGSILSPAPNGPISRPFAFDGLSRLTQGTNPESGAITYHYDADGNLHTRTDAVGTVTTYLYDKVNRLIGKSYSDGATASACFEYGETSQGYIGRLIAEWTQTAICPSVSSAPPSSGNLTEREIGSYDPMGRVTTDEQCAPTGNCGSGGPFYNLGYSYDLLGDVTGFSNGLSVQGTPLSFVANYNGAARLASLTGSQTGSGSQTALYTPTGYTPAGALTDALIGIGSTPGITFHRDYNPRLWNTDERDTVASIPGTATASVSGAEQIDAYSSGSFTFRGTEQCSFGTCDGGQFLVTIGTGQPILVTYSQNSTPATLASNLASLIGTGCTSYGVQVAVNGPTVSLQSCAAGTTNSYSISATPDGHSSSFGSYSFSVTASGSTMTPIINATTSHSGIAATFSTTGSGQVGTGLFQFFVYPSGSGPPGVYAGTLSWSSTDTTSTLAARLAAAIGTCSGSGAAVGAIASGPSIYLVSCQTGITYVFYGALDYSNGSAGFQVNLISTPASGAVPTITFSGAEQGGQTGTILVNVTQLGFQGPPQYVGINWGSSSTPNTLATALAAGLGSCSSNPNGMDGLAVGATVYLGSCNATASYTISAGIPGCSCSGSNPADFAAVVTASPDTGQLPGVPGATYDSGTVKLTVSGTQIASASYNGNSTPETVASALAANSSGNGVANVTANGDSLTITSIGDGSQSDYSYSITGTSSSPGIFANASFAGSPGSGSLTGGGSTSLYNWAINSFASNGNVTSATDSVMGSWTYNYDHLNRASSATDTACGSGQMTLSWAIDPFGNRSSQTASATGNCSLSATQPTLTINANNQVAGFAYDADGRVIHDSVNTYAYDGEGRVVSLNNGATTYVYDAEGRRVAKGGASAANYLLGLGGEQVTELTPTGGWTHSNVWIGGKLIGTYAGPNDPAQPQGYYFPLTDWLGTKRVGTYSTGLPEETCVSFPFGDGPPCQGPNPTEHRFTQKERDAESGNDYFGARYYGSSMGRFLSPDWSAKVAPVPYAKLENPQSLNLYGYMRNNPLAGVDQDGHCSGDDCGKVSVTATTSGDAPLESSNGGRTATAEGTVQYSFTYNKAPLANTQIHEDVSNKSARDGVPEKAKLTTGDDATGPKNGNPPGVVTDTTGISITTPFGGAEATMSNSVFSKDTTQTLSFQTPTGSTCSVTETRTLSNADSKGQPTDTYTIKLTSPATQQATPVKPPKTPTT